MEGILGPGCKGLLRWLSEKIIIILTLSKKQTRHFGKFNGGPLDNHNGGHHLFQSKKYFLIYFMPRKESHWFRVNIFDELLTFPQKNEGTLIKI